MSFYQLNYSINPGEIGTTYPQSQTARHLISADDPRYLGKQFVGYLKDIPLPEPVIHPDAKVSDLLSTTATWRLIMSAKLKQVLERFISEDFCQFLEMKVHYLDQTHDYWMLNPLQFNMDLIDFSGSEVWLCGLGNIKVKRVDIENLDSYNYHFSEYQMPDRLNIYNVKFQKDIIQNFIQLKNAPGIRYYVSDILKEEIINTGCTGISFTEME